MCKFTLRVGKSHISVALGTEAVKHGNEVGFLPLDRLEADLFFQVVSARYVSTTR